MNASQCSLGLMDPFSHVSNKFIMKNGRVLLVKMSVIVSKIPRGISEVIFLNDNTLSPCLLLSAGVPIIIC